MAEFQAWAATGTVTKLRSWLEAFGQSSGGPGGKQAQVIVAERVVEHLAFMLEQENGPAIEVSLANPGITIKDGHHVTVVWAAPEDRPQGNTHCICVVNRSSGAVARLAHNLPRLRGEPGLLPAIGFGLLSTLPALFAALAWQLAPQRELALDQGTLIMVTMLGAIFLFGLGLLISRWVIATRAQDDDRKIWSAAADALEAAGAGRYMLGRDT
jgi:hypothetical protein